MHCGSTGTLFRRDVNLRPLSIMKRTLFAPTVSAVSVLVTIPIAAHAQAPYTVLHSMSGYTYSDGPQAPLLAATDGRLYGTTRMGGTFNRGTVFRLTTTGEVTVLHSFAGGNSSYPAAALVEAADGNLYGTTQGDGNVGTLFRVRPAGAVETVNPATPCIWPSALVQGLDGNLYGTCLYSTYPQKGTAFRVSTTGVFTQLHVFTGSAADGGYPLGLTLGPDGNFYGTTSNGGASDRGIVFKMTPGGSTSVLYHFTGGNDGGVPQAGLTLAPDGNFYGTTVGYASGSPATAFRISPAGALAILHTFAGGVTDGAYPNTRLTLASDGNLYGTTSRGGPANLGGIFRLALDGSYAIVWWFIDPGFGIEPLGLTQGADGRLYGTTARGGIADLGTIFTTTLSFDGMSVHHFFLSHEGVGADSLIQAADGNFYGVSHRAAYNLGAIFRISPGGAFSIVYTFTGGDDGAFPNSLLDGGDGYLYGTTSTTVFRLGFGGPLQTLQTFSGPSWSDPYPSHLVLGFDGNLYGTTAAGGSAEYGTVFRLTRAGQATILRSFSYGDPAGAYPRHLVPATDGAFYGTTDRAAFRITPSGDFAVIYAFQSEDLWTATLAGQATDGHLYGATSCSTSSVAGGKVFRLSLTGTFTALINTGTICSDYAPADVTLAIGRDGQLYGTVWGAGARPPFSVSGTAFAMSLGGDVTVLHQFSVQDGLYPGRLVQASDGNVYGGTLSGGAFGAGVVFRIDRHLPLSPATVVSVRTGSVGARLAWLPVPGATSYIVKRINPGGDMVVLASGITGTSFTDPGAPLGLFSFSSYVVIAVNGFGESLPSPPVSLWNSMASRTPTISTAGDFDGDGKTDLTIYRSTTGEWLTHRSSDQTASTSQWGAPLLEDRPVPADYDGDGRDDIAVYRETTGQWFIVRSSNSTLWQASWGAPSLGDLPVPADYDGDGLADIAVYRGSTGEWFIHRSSTRTLRYEGWGAPSFGDVPVPTDYDGDGAADVAVYRAMTGEWFVHRSQSNSALQVGWGAAGLGDLPVPADYDGDGKADFAVYRSPTGEWFLAYSGGGSFSLACCSPLLGDVPVPVDFNGDGRADIGVYRRSTGRWLEYRNGSLWSYYDWGAPSLGDAVRKF